MSQSGTRIQYYP